MTLDKMISEARARTGLRDLGAGFDPEPFERLIASVESEDKFSRFGSKAFPEFVIHALVNRLEIEGWYSRHPEIDQEQIVAPLFGVGLPRTGSTLLGCVLALDTDTRSYRLWESEKPCPPPLAGDDADPRIEESDFRRRESYRLRPELAPSVPYSGSNDPVECYEMFFLTGLYSSYECFVHCPKYSEWIFDPARDFKPAYEYHKRTLKLLQWRCPPKRWSLKMPNHSLTISALNEVYPDARFVMTHRDPVKALPSTAHVNSTVRSIMLKDPMQKFVGAAMIEHWGEALKRLLEFRKNHERKFFDIQHSALISDSVTEIKRLYKWLDWPLREVYLDRIRAWRRENPQVSSNQVNPADYGMDLSAIRRHFKFYYDRFATAAC